MNTFPVRTALQLGQVLRGYREAKGMTQQSVGARVGLAQKAVSKLELAPGTAGLQQIFKLLAALDLELVVRPRGGTPSPSEW